MIFELAMEAEILFWRLRFDKLSVTSEGKKRLLKFFI
jgi:hypothetical protein